MDAVDGAAWKAGDSSQKVVHQQDKPRQNGNQQTQQTAPPAAGDGGKGEIEDDGG